VVLGFPIFLAPDLIGAEENWERIDRFLGAVVPIATAAKVRLAAMRTTPTRRPATAT
jgi:D-mannonate dehydratase